MSFVFNVVDVEIGGVIYFEMWLNWGLMYFVIMCEEGVVGVGGD